MSRESNEGSGRHSLMNSIANGISKKSFFKGFLSRGGSQKNESVGSRESSANGNNVNVRDSN